MGEEPVIEPWDRDVSMKALLAVAVKEAVKLALIDTADVEVVAGEAVPPRLGLCARPDGSFPRRLPTDEERARWAQDIYSMPNSTLAHIDPGALAQNVAVRLLGKGGWTVRGVYAGNATAHEVLDASVVRPDHDPIADLAIALGLSKPEAS